MDEATKDKLRWHTTFHLPLSDFSMDISKSNLDWKTPESPAVLPGYNPAWWSMIVPNTPAKKIVQPIVYPPIDMSVFDPPTIPNPVTVGSDFQFHSEIIKDGTAHQDGHFKIIPAKRTVERTYPEISHTGIIEAKR